MSNIETRYHGNLRVFSSEPSWALHFRKFLGDLTIFAENAFGTHYCEDTDGTTYILYPETGDVENIGITKSEFFQAIDINPSETIEQDLYDEAVCRFGMINPDKHFAFIVELTLGGDATVDNISIESSDLHMVSLLKIADQIHAHPPGTTYRDVQIEE